MTKQDHQETVRWVLQTLKENKLHFNPEKCEFEKEEVDYLGVIMGNRKIHTNPAKIKVIRDWPIPTQVVEVQEFIGFLNFYQRFIKYFSRIVWSLNDLMKREAIFNWTKEWQGAFNELKRWITKLPILLMICDDGEVRVETNACQYVTGALITQEQEGAYRPIAYSSKSFNDIKWNYPTHDHELYTIIRMVPLLGQEQVWNLDQPQEPQMVYDQTRFELKTSMMGHGTGQIWLHIEVHKVIYNDTSRCLVEIPRQLGGDRAQWQGTGITPFSMNTWKQIGFNSRTKSKFIHLQDKQ